MQYRDLDGNLGNGPEAFYDAALNITWLRNANVNLGPNTTGQVDWPQALAWSSSLVVSGVSGWRLPTMVDTGAPGCGFNAVGGSDCGHNAATATSELAHLFYVSLGNAARCVPGVAICTPPPQWLGRDEQRRLPEPGTWCLHHGSRVRPTDHTEVDARHR